jgi:hypothetical protein
MLGLGVVHERNVECIQLIFHSTNQMRGVYLLAHVLLWSVVGVVEVIGGFALSPWLC